MLAPLARLLARLRAALLAARSTLLALGAGAGSALLVTAAVALSGHADADARAHFSSAYGFERTWNAAVRLLRVELDAQIVEKDQQTGYLLFTFRPGDAGGKQAKGALEFIGGREPGQSVQVVVQLPDLPRYHEQNLLDQLARKLRQDYGDPPAKIAKTPTKEPEKSDAGE